MNFYEEIAADLLTETCASRTTVRLLNQENSLLLMAEQCSPGVEMMGQGPQIDPRLFPTYQYLEEHQTLLIQEDCRRADVAPPPSLTDHYDVAAQMLAPVIVDGTFRGTVSVHQQGCTRAWTDADIAMLMRAREAVEGAVSAHGTTV